MPFTRADMTHVTDLPKFFAEFIKQVIVSGLKLRFLQDAPDFRDTLQNRILHAYTPHYIDENRKVMIAFLEVNYGKKPP
jgi:hypothetical protein